MWVECGREMRCVEIVRERDPESEYEHKVGAGRAAQTSQQMVARREPTWLPFTLVSYLLNFKWDDPQVQRGAGSN